MAILRPGGVQTTIPLCRAKPRQQATVRKGENDNASDSLDYVGRNGSDHTEKQESMCVGLGSKTIAIVRVRIRVLSTRAGGLLLYVCYL